MSSGFGVTDVSGSRGLFGFVGSVGSTGLLFGSTGFVGSAGSSLALNVTVNSWFVAESLSNTLSVASVGYGFSLFLFSTFSYPRAKIALIVAVTSPSFVKFVPSSPESTTDGANPFPSTSTNFVIANCEPFFTYTIGVS